MRSILFALLYFLPISPVSALPIKAGTFTSFDQFDEPAVREDTARVHEAEKHLAGARKGGELALGFLGEMHLIWPFYFKNGSQVSDGMPYWEEYLIESLMIPDPLVGERTLHSFLAESVTVKPDLQTFVINLRDGIKFADGTELTAQHVLESFEFLRLHGGILLEDMLNKYWGTPKLRVLTNGILKFPALISRS